MPLAEKRFASVEKIAHLMNVQMTWMMSSVLSGFAYKRGASGYFGGVGEGRWSDEREKYGRDGTVSWTRKPEGRRNYCIAKKKNRMENNG